MILARHLASGPDTSLQNAIATVEKAPFIYMKNLKKNELEQHLVQLKKLGVEFKLAEAKGSTDDISDEKTPPAVLQEAAPPPHAFIHMGEKPALKTGAVKNNKKTKKSFLKRTMPSYDYPSNTRRPGSRWTIIPAAGLAIFLIGLFFFVKRQNYTIKQTGPLPSSSNRRQEENSSHKTAQAEKKKESGMPRMHITPNQRARSSTYADSAAGCKDNLECTIRFYKIAISFNQYNLNAWYGLVNTYSQAKMFQEAAEAEARMRELFDKETFSVNDMVKPYGSLTDFVTENRVCRISFVPKNSKKQELYTSTFNIARAIRAEYGCQNITLYASTGKGTGMLVHIGSRDFPSTMSEYLNTADISFVE